MGASKLVLAEKDMEYGRALARAISNLHSEFEVTIIDLEENCSDKQFDKKWFCDYDMILLGGFTNETAIAIGEIISNYDRIIILTDHSAENLMKQAENTEEHFWYLFKYGNMNDLISDLNFLIAFVTGKKSYLKKRLAPDLIGYFSCCGGVGKSVIALGTSRELSRYYDKKVLYLSFEEFPATELFIRKNALSRSICDYLYYLLEKKNESFCSHIEGFVSSDEFGVESFNPSNGRNDLNDLNQEELILMIKLISDSNRYDTITLDLNSCLTNETLFLMNLCSKIIFIQNNNPISKYKCKKMIAFLTKLSAFIGKNRFLLVENQSSCTESEGYEEINDSSFKTIYIEKEDNSFRYALNHMDIDMYHSFGIGIKKIAEEIISMEPGKERSICMGNSVP